MCLQQRMKPEEAHGSQKKIFLWHGLNPIKLSTSISVVVCLGINELTSEHYNDKCLTQELRHGILGSTLEIPGTRNVLPSFDFNLITPCCQIFYSKLLSSLK